MGLLLTGVFFSPCHVSLVLPHFSNGISNPPQSTYLSQTVVSCISAGFPQPTITWATPMFSTLPKRMAATVQHSLTADHLPVTNSTLTITRTYPEDNGTFECTARSAAGVETITTQVSVPRKHTIYTFSPSSTHSLLARPPRHSTAPKPLKQSFFWSVLFYHTTPCQLWPLYSLLADNYVLYRSMFDHFRIHLALINSKKKKEKKRKIHCPYSKMLSPILFTLSFAPEIFRYYADIRLGSGFTSGQVSPQALGDKVNINFILFSSCPQLFSDTGHLPCNLFFMLLLV